MGNEFWVTEYARIYANPAPAVNEVPRMPPNPPISWHVFQLCKQEVVGSSPIISTKNLQVGGASAGLGVGSIAGTPRKLRESEGYAVPHLGPGETMVSRRTIVKSLA